MSHYYINDNKLDHKVKSYEVVINNISLTMFTDLGVFSKDYLDFGTRVLLESIQLNDTQKTVIDMGCGYGPIGIYIGKAYPDKHVYLFDVNERAVEMALKNQKVNAVNNIQINVSNLFDQVNVKADVIVTNPPIRAGKQTVFKLYEDAYSNLNDGGVLYVVIQKKQGAPSSVNHLTSIFGECEVIEKKKGYWILFAQK
ncbi:MAG: 16S rRNA methyltransferase [Tenericutes bacterium HGW-Tenericutes-7]|nr:MAG: 16S rRNA methyltransferase [Tenericutes bacterium HGW-Tenericutes-7]